MGRISEIEGIVAGTLPPHQNLKLIVRGRPTYLDPQLNGAYTRFAGRKGSQFSCITPDNQAELTEDAPKETYRITMESRPSWIDVGCLVRVGDSADIGELHLVQDLIETTALDVNTPLLTTHSANDPNRTQYLTLVGTPGQVLVVGSSGKDAIIETWWPIVPGDLVLMSLTPTVLESLIAVTLKSTTYIDSRPGTGFEPAVVYRYRVEPNTSTGLFPFSLTVNLPVYLKANPLYTRGTWGSVGGDLAVPNDMGPFLVDMFSGGLMSNHKVETSLGLQLWDSFGSRINYSDLLRGDWQPVPQNYLVLERPISSDSLLFWQKIKGNFQFQKAGFFQAELDENGEFIMSSDLLVPKWPTERQRGWVIPLLARAPTRVCVQFEPQDIQIFDIPGNVLTFIRPKILATGVAEIQRILVTFKGSPRSRVEIRDWEFDGPLVTSLSYYARGGLDTFGENSWMSGGFCLKSLFFNLNMLKARYSDGVSHYNAGRIYA